MSSLQPFCRSYRRLLAAACSVALLVLVAPSRGEAQTDRRSAYIAKLIKFEMRVESADPFDVSHQEGAEAKAVGEIRPGQLVRVFITGTPKPGHYTYPITPPIPGMPTAKLSRLQFGDAEKGTFRPLPPVTETPPHQKEDRDEGIYFVHDKPFTWSQDVLVLPEAKPGPHKLNATVRLMVCNDKTCTDPGVPYPPLETTITVSKEKPAPLSAELKKRLKDAEKLAAAPSPPESAPRAATADGARPTTPGADQNSLTALLLSAAGGAFLMLLTPCVFPMIPITVNFFLKQSEKEHHNPLLMASVYSGTIILLLTLVMVALGKFVIDLANDPWFNLALGGVLAAFALSLFGMYELELPSGLARFTSAREGQGGMLGTIFMALTFTITSFTCTGPFLGAMLAPVAGLRPPFLHLLLAALVYSATFAAPFFLLALFPSALRKLPRSGGWLNTIKVTMGFLELGAALKFLANTDLAWNPGNPRLFTYDTVLCAWMALSFACGLYLVGVFRLPHDEPVEHIGVVRMLFATIFFGLTLYMMPALRRETPQGLVGEGIVAFLPPSFDENRGAGSRGGGEAARLAWHLQYENAWKEAVRDNKLIFIDFTGVNCTNCRDNEKNVFPKAEVQSALRKYARVQLYTDTVPDRSLSASDAKRQADRNSEWRDVLTNGDATNPYYVIFRPDPKEPFKDGKLNGQKIDLRNGTIRDIPDFVRFLQTPQPQVALGATKE